MPRTHIHAHSPSGPIERTQRVNMAHRSEAGCRLMMSVKTSNKSFANFVVFSFCFCIIGKSNVVTLSQTTKCSEVGVVDYIIP